MKHIPALKNPILPGFHADPCLCRRGEDYYLAVSSFEWFPGVPIYHSRDMRHWELLTHGLQDDRAADLRRLPSAKGVWAPCLTWCEEDGLFYLTYSVMNSMEARYFDVNNYVITAPEVTGPWSAPVYLHSAGFDGSMFHDRDGKKYVISLEWETRPGYEKPGAICLVEYDPAAKAIVGLPRRIYTGGTDRGCIEGPHLYRRGEWYYLLCAEGGTGYAHCVTMARSHSVWGPYEPDPANPILTSAPGDFNERADWDHLKPRYYNPNTLLQKAGHGSYVDTAAGETYLAFHCSRPFLPELRCTLGREAGLARMVWTEDGWLRTWTGDNLAREEVLPSALPDAPVERPPARDLFQGPELAPYWYAPRRSPGRFARVGEGGLTLRGGESLCSLHEVALLARKLTSVQVQVTTRLDFAPTRYQHTAGLVLYYDNMDYAYLEKTWDEGLGAPVLLVRHLENGVRTDSRPVPAPPGPVWLRLTIQGRRTAFAWSADGAEYQAVGPVLDTSTFSDEYCKYGEFTGAFVGMACEDGVLHRLCAQFACFDYQADEEAGVNR